METSQYLEQLLLKYSATFDIYKPYYIEGKEFPAYGYFFADLRKENPEKAADLWASHSYEHILFLTADKILQTHVKEAMAIITDYMEPKLVRKDGRLPAKNHMYSFLTVILISQYPADKEALKAVKRYSFEKDYLFKLRGFCTGQLMLVSMEDHKITCSRGADQQTAHFKDRPYVQKKRAWLQGAFEEGGGLRQE